MRPYLDELQDLWPFLLLAVAIGGIVSVAIAAAVLTAKRRCQGLPRLHAKKWRMALPERLPLLWGSDREATSHPNYQTTI